jgi:regulator of sigma E protease
MAFGLLYTLFAILGLGILVFIHELGHYIMARRQGMRVEAFAIGFGKPIFTWEHDGVKWHICMLPFGGYVKIAGMQKEGGLEPSEIPDGFYGKKPWQRIKVAFAGPLVNIAFAFLVFCALWMSGGRNKFFAEFTHRIGWVDPKSALYMQGVRPGDFIESYDGRPFNGMKDLLLASFIKGETTEIEGFKIDYTTGQRTPFHYTLKTYDNPTLYREKLNTIGVMAPARYFIYEDGGRGIMGSLIPGSPMIDSGIQPQDRLLWADGAVLFSNQQLSELINDSTALLTVKRGEKTFLSKVPRLQINEFKLTAPERGEIDDWLHEAGLKGHIQDFYFIPYNLSPAAEVEGRLRFIDDQMEKEFFGSCDRCPYFNPLSEGDQIIAVDGAPIQTPAELFAKMQSRHVLLIVQRDKALVQKTLWTQADQEFDEFSTEDLNAITSSIGTDHPITHSGNLYLLSPVTPKALADFSLTTVQREQMAKQFVKSREEVEAIADAQKREAALHELEKTQNRFVLGIPLRDREVSYNPTPTQQFSDVFKETWRTLVALFSGSANPKYMAGPVGIIQIVQQSWTVGAKEALYWMALISLNLGILNLLPLPILDGGHILFSAIEMVTKKPINSKVMERLIIPFIVLIIAFFLFVTYQDILRLFSRFL